MRDIKDTYKEYEIDIRDKDKGVKEDIIVKRNKRDKKIKEVKGNIRDKGRYILYKR